MEILVKIFMKKFIRKPNRLPFKQIYEGENWYFITVCVQDKKCIFGIEENGKILLNQFGRIVERKINSLNSFYDLMIDEYVIMPNHIHLIIGEVHMPLSKIMSGLKSFTYKEIKNIVEEGSCLPNFPNGVEEGSCLPHEDFDVNSNGCSNVDSNVDSNGDQEVSATVKNLILQYGAIWHKSFYDHVVRDGEDLNRVREYIMNNPLNWSLDELSLHRVSLDGGVREVGER